VLAQHLGEVDSLSRKGIGSLTGKSNANQLLSVVLSEMRTAGNFRRRLDDCGEIETSPLWDTHTENENATGNLPPLNGWLEQEYFDQTVNGDRLGRLHDKCIKYYEAIHAPVDGDGDWVGRLAEARRSLNGTQ
jgi:hypothetical protein